MRPTRRPSGCGQSATLSRDYRGIGPPSGVARVDQLEALQGEPRVVGGEAPALVDHERGEIAGRHDGHRRSAPPRARRSSGRQSRRPGWRRRTPFPTAAPRRCCGRSPSAGDAIRPCAIGHPVARAPRGISRCPGDMAPPMYCPSALTTSKVVAVPPKSTTTAGPPYRVATARALTIRSVPTSRGLSVSTGTPVRTPGLHDHARHRRRSGRRAWSRHSCSTDGTVAQTAIPPTSLLEVAEQPADQHRPLVGGARLDGRHPPVGGDLAVVDQPQHRVAVADVGGEEGVVIAGRARGRRP